MNDLSPYELLGGEAGVRKLVDLFYDHMDSDAAALGIRQMHAKSLHRSRDKLFLFLSGWLGGPERYTAQYGPPMLRRRHLPFAIGVAERDQWMHCMRRALDDMPIDDLLKSSLEQAFMSTANHMRNQAEDSAGGVNPLSR